MDYKEAKRLLFDENVKLTLEQAEDIIQLFDSNARVLSNLLKADKKRIMLNSYKGFNHLTEKHEFEGSNKFLFSNNVVKKFFELRDDDISVAFVLSLIFHLSKNDDTAEVYAWPYFYNNNELVDFTSFAVLKTLISSRFWVFDFRCDYDGRVFEKLIKLTKDDDIYKELLAINSFNIDGFINNYGRDSKIDYCDLARLFAYSSHYFKDMGDFYGGFRKLLINYIDNAMYTVEYFLQKERERKFGAGS